MAEQVQPNTFHPYHYTLKPSIESKLNALLKEYALQFAKDETVHRDNSSHRNGPLIQAPPILYPRNLTQLQ